MKYLEKLLVGIIVCLFVGCSQIKSGRHIRYSNEKSLEQLAKELGLTVEDIKEANGKDFFRSGDWVFIPRPTGIAGWWEQKVQIKVEPQDYLGNNLLWPVPAGRSISSYYKPPERPDHLGIDIPASRGAPVLAAESGVVYFVGKRLKGYGNIVVVKHTSEIYTVYAHNRKNLVKRGQKVNRGQIIAQVGNTGKSTGPHLHFEVRIHDRPVDPIPFLGKDERMASLESHLVP